LAYDEVPSASRPAIRIGCLTPPSPRDRQRRLRFAAAPVVEDVVQNVRGRSVACRVVVARVTRRQRSIEPPGARRLRRLRIDTALRPIYR
jgi:hypothetical protein